MNRPPLSVLVGFALGLVSLYFGAVTGLPGLILSLVGLRAVNRSDGRLTGAGLAVAGLVMGAVGTLITATGVAAMVVLRLEATANRAGCMNHLRQIGVALNEYGGTHGTFPPATRDPAGLPPPRRLSWLTEVLPGLAAGTKANQGYKALADRIDRAAGWDAPANAAVLASPVRPFLCPGHPSYRPRGSPGLTHYVGLAGVGTDAAGVKREGANAGVFGHDRGVAPREAEGGISNTLAVAETAEDNGPWLAGGRPTVRGVPEGEGLIGPGRPFGGLHPGFMNGLYVDGSVRALSDDVPGDLVRRLVRLHGR